MLRALKASPLNETERPSGDNLYPCLRRKMGHAIDAMRWEVRVRLYRSLLDSACATIEINSVGKPKIAKYSFGLPRRTRSYS
jgi:hypothetical protein